MLSMRLRWMAQAFLDGFTGGVFSTDGPALPRASSRRIAMTRQSLPLIATGNLAPRV
jgi:hypothetical protein